MISEKQFRKATSLPHWLGSIALLFFSFTSGAEIEHFANDGEHISYATKTERNDLAFTGQIFTISDGSDDFGADALVEKLRLIAEKSDATLVDVVRLNIYIREERPDLRAAAVDLVTEHWQTGTTPAISIVPGKLPDDAILALDAVIALDSRTSGIVPLHFDNDKVAAVIAPAEKGIIFASGRVAKAKTYAESIPAMHELVMGDTTHLGVSVDDVVSIRAYINDLDRWQQAKRELEALFAKPPPPIIFIEWSRSDAVEVEYIFATSEETADEPAVHHFPNTPKPSPVFSRGAVVHSDQIIFMGAVGGQAGDPEQEVSTLLDTVLKYAEATGSDADHLVKTTYFVNDPDVDKATGPVRPRYYNPTTPPAASKIARHHVGFPDHHISMDMIAVPSSK